MSQQILSAIQLEKSYRKRQVVSGMSLKVKQQEIVGLLGPNGAGKTTCFYMMVGLTRPDRGKVTLNKQIITHLPLYKRAQKGISYLPQEASIFRRLNVYENIMAILQLQQGLTKKVRQQRTEALLAEFHLEHVRHTPGIALSGGERRRVEIARALATNPQFILLDEPFAGIDPISIIDIKRIINQLRERGLGILITDHNVRETLDICSRAYIVNQGSVIAEGSPEVVLNNQQVRDVYLGDDFIL